VSREINRKEEEEGEKKKSRRGCWADATDSRLHQYPAAKELRRSETEFDEGRRDKEISPRKGFLFSPVYYAQ
jgi:hypothetical protein